ncbi:cell wall-binding repeat-containing protein [Neobacillus pocheonensis]|uniref:N,N-dimethylformamidase beta subunit family domain-containing protein n=1 Tax=Neobacillus pocheonensis TaxID=363869 RepID=UPI003D2863C8
MKKFSLILSFTFILFILPAITAHAEENRIAGKDRFEVAVNISKQNWPQGASTVFISNYLAFADALSATPLAYQSNAPILLSHPGSLTELTKQELIRLKPQQVVLVGGPGSLSNQIVEDLKGLNIPTISRIDGRDRYEVSANVAAKMANSSTIVVANGMVFADALSIAPYAAANGFPILLTDKNQLPSSIVQYLNAENINQSIIVGGEGSVSDSIKVNLKNPIRIGGADRYEVSANIAKTYFPAPAKGYLATGLTFADALTGSVAAAKQKAPMLLTRADQIPENIQSFLITKHLTDVIILGGTGSVKDGIYYLPGSWAIKKPGGVQLQGYADKTSYAPGEMVQFFINSQKNYNVEIYRMGYYDGNGAQFKIAYGKFTGISQTSSINPETLSANWTKSFHFGIPRDWESGMYMAKIIDSDIHESYIPFLIKNPNPNPNGMGVIIAMDTYQAYNNWGGKSLYGYNSSGGAASIKVSFNRPYLDGNGAGQFFQYEYNMIRWLEKKGYQLSYFTNQDVDQGLLSTSQVKTLLIPGHDEYWTMKTRNEIETLSKSKMNLGVFNANVGYWQVRYEDNNRTIVAYKEKADQDPYHSIDPALVTTLFRLNPVNNPEDRMYGIMYNGIPEKTVPLEVTNASHWLFEGTGLQNGDRIPGVIGGEIDRYYGLLQGVEIIAHSPAILYGKESYGDTVWYQKPEGGKAFAAGTFYWNWFLDPYGHESQASYNPAIERITINALNKLME